MEDYTIWFYSRIRAVETALQDKEFLADGRFTIADIAVGYALHFGKRLGLSSATSQYCALSGSSDV